MRSNIGTTGSPERKKVNNSRKIYDIFHEIPAQGTPSRVHHHQDSSAPHNEGIVSVSWEGEKPKPHLKPWESEWHQNLNKPIGGWGEGIISHLHFFLPSYVGKGQNKDILSYAKTSKYLQHLLPMFLFLGSY